jgi:uncharacterized protein (DUF2141 family)
MFERPVLATLLLAAALSAPALAHAAPLTIDVTNVRNAHGRVRVDVCPQDKFLDDGCPYHLAVPARAGTATLTLDVPDGHWAVQAFHDENANDEIDRNFLGMPKEGVGFSRDARIVLSPPKWADAVIAHVGPQRITFKLRYWTGPGSPEDWKARHPKE